MKVYELLYIIPPKFTWQETFDIEKEVRKILKEARVNILGTKPFEKRQLAYPVKRCHFGIYGQMKFEGNEEQIKKIDEKLRLEPNIIRHNVFKFKATQAPVIRDFREKREKKYVKPKQAAKEIKEPPVTPKPDEGGKTEKIKLEELDKKLEELLKE